MAERKEDKRGFVVRKSRKKEKLKVILEYDEDVPEEERERKTRRVFKILRSQGEGFLF